MRKLQTIGYALVALLLVFTFALAFQGELLGNTLSSAILPSQKAQTKTTQANKADTETPAIIDEALYHPKKLPILPAEKIDTETLWLARCIFSETKKPEEQELVAWVVRNRVETQYRGQVNYQDVVLDPFQFSAFNPETRTRNFYSGLTPQSKVPGWQRALSIAHTVRHYHPKFRPFSLNTRHFYSEQSMLGKSHPDWANGLRSVTPERDYSISAQRFRFYENIL